MIRLTYRERWLVVGLTVFAVGWALFALGVSPAVERIETLERTIPEKYREFEELRTKSAEYLTLQAGLDDLKREVASGQEGFELVAFLESVTAELHLAQKVTAMKQERLQLDASYHEIIVEVELQRLTLKELIDFLVKTKSSNHFLRIKSLYIKTNMFNSNQLDSVVQVSTLKPSREHARQDSKS